MDNEESVRTTLKENLVEASALSADSDIEEASQMKAVEEETVEEEVQIEVVEKPIATEEKSSECSSTHSKAVQEQINRAQKRKERLQKFNYRFRNNSVIEIAESEPAYKRQGVQLSEATHSSEETISNLNLSMNEDGELELKNKNSFLHDNVD